MNAVLPALEVHVVERAVGFHGDELEILFPLVGHADWCVRGEVIQLLARAGDTRAVPSILRRLELEQDEFVREVILSVLMKLEG